MTCLRMSDFLWHSGCSFPVAIDDAEADEAEGGLNEAGACQVFASVVIQLCLKVYAVNNNTTLTN